MSKVNSAGTASTAASAGAPHGARSPDRFALILEFEQAPATSLFDQGSIAAVAGCSEGLLAKLRLNGQGPTFIRLGRNLVRYSKHDVERWLKTRRSSLYVPQEKVGAVA